MHLPDPGIPLFVEKPGQEGTPWAEGDPWTKGDASVEEALAR